MFSVVTEPGGLEPVEEDAGPDEANDD